MTEQQIFSIIFSIILLPINFCCAFWLFREAINLTGMTFKKFLGATSHATLSINTSRRSLKRRQRFLARFFKEKSSDPPKSIRLMWTFGICTLPGLAALSLATYAAMHKDKLEYAFIGNLILVVINIGLVIWGKIYRKNNPLDDITAEKLNAKRVKEKANGRKIPAKNIIVYALVGAFFFGILLFFMSSISQVSDYRSRSNSIDHSLLISILNEKGYETANIPTTYWEIDENKLMNVAAGIKGDSKFEFYDYSDNESIDLVYSQIVNDIAPDIENSERESHETYMPDGNKMFTMVINGVFYLVMYKNDTLVYAYSPESLDEINEILIRIGYLKSR